MDLLTKFDLQKDTADHWFNLQTTLIQADWLQEHMAYWYRQMGQESEDKITQQSLGGPGRNFLGEGQHNIDLTLLKLTS